MCVAQLKDCSWFENEGQLFFCSCGHELLYDRTRQKWKYCPFCGEEIEFDNAEWLAEEHTEQEFLEEMEM